ncbi:hypothetical protein JCM13591A_29890 [Microbacterium xylanilyticum]
MISESWAELGGLGAYVTTPSRRAVTTERAVTAIPAPHVHAFDGLSGYCSCGRRDDGTAAEGSSAWARDREVRACLSRIERQLDNLAATAAEATPKGL